MKEEIVDLIHNTAEALSDGVITPAEVVGFACDVKEVIEKFDSDTALTDIKEAVTETVTEAVNSLCGE